MLAEESILTFWRKQIWTEWQWIKQSPFFSLPSKFRFSIFSTLYWEYNFDGRISILSLFRISMIILVISWGRLNIQRVVCSISGMVCSTEQERAAIIFQQSSWPSVLRLMFNTSSGWNRISSMASCESALRPSFDCQGLHCLLDLRGPHRHHLQNLQGR